MKLDHWDHMKEITYQKRANDKITAELGMIKKEQKIEKFLKNHDKSIHDQVEIIQNRRGKWLTRI